MKEKRGSTRRNTNPAVELHIEKLVLHGFAPCDRHRIGAAVEAELTRMIAEQGVPASLANGGEIALLDAGSFEVAKDSTTKTIGGQVARALYGGLTP